MNTKNSCLLTRQQSPMAISPHWTGGLTLKFISVLSNKTHSPVELCRNPAAFSLYGLGAYGLGAYGLGAYGLGANNQL